MRGTRPPQATKRLATATTTNIAAAAPTTAAPGPSRPLAAPPKLQPVPWFSAVTCALTTWMLTIVSTGSRRRWCPLT